MESRVAFTFSSKWNDGNRSRLVKEAAEGVGQGGGGGSRASQVAGLVKEAAVGLVKEPAEGHTRRLPSALEASVTKGAAATTLQPATATSRHYCMLV